MIKIVHRQAQPEEIGQALALLKESALAIQAKGLAQWSVWLDPAPEKIEWVEEGFGRHEFYFVETEEGQLAGMYRLLAEDLLYWGKLPDNAAYIHSLVVRKEFAGQDLGKQIIQEIEENLIKNGTRILRLDCNAANVWLCNYYEQQGFVKTGEKQMPHALNHLYEKNL
jgi:ribosomal protein S18 acetylase RimI-like enzyme